MEQNSNKRARATRVALRSCLCCGAAFAAESPYLRVCPLCKESEEWQSGNVDFVQHERRPANDN
jgi:hypothetical protein